MRLLTKRNKTVCLSWLMVVFLAVTCTGRDILEPSSMDTRKIEIVSGKSLVLKLGIPVKKKLRVSIGSPEIADCLVLPPNEIYIKGKNAGLTNLMVWQEGDLLAIYDVEVSYDVSRLKEQLYRVLPNEKGIKVSATNDSITLLGKVSNNGNLSQALVLARSYAPEGKVNNLLQVGGTHQIMLGVKVAEMNRSAGKDLGIDLSFYNNSGDIGVTLLGPLGTTNPLTGTAVSSAVNSFFRFSKDSSTWAGFLNALQEDGMAKILAEPNLISMSGQTASFLAGGEYPIPVPDEDGITVNYKEYGVGLQFTPTVLDEDRISIKVDTEFSELDFSAAVQFSGFIVPGVTTRRAATTIELKDGQSFALAGLLSENIRENIKKFPFLGDIPVLGTLFKSTSFQKEETELVIIATPHFVKPLASDNQPLPTDSYSPPGDGEIYLNLKKQHTPSTGSQGMEGRLDGEFGHTFEDE